METSTITPYSAIRITAPPTKDGKSRTGWVVILTRTGKKVEFVWQHQRGPEELYRKYPGDLITILAGFSVTVKEYERVLREDFGVRL